MSASVGPANNHGLEIGKTYAAGPKYPWNPSQPFDSRSLVTEFVGQYVGPKYVGGNYKGIEFKHVQLRGYNNGKPIFYTHPDKKYSTTYIDPKFIENYVFTPYAPHIGGRRRIRKTRYRRRHHKARQTRRRN
jgi:hypothetical protein